MLFVLMYFNEQCGVTKALTYAALLGRTRM